MPKSDNQKLKILYILDYLQKNSHQEHPVRAGELTAMLKKHVQPIPDGEKIQGAD